MNGSQRGSLFGQLKFSFGNSPFQFSFGRSIRPPRARDNSIKGEGKERDKKNMYRADGLVNSLDIRSAVDASHVCGCAYGGLIKLTRAVV